ncbi:MAG: HAD family phosphatase [Firmicutes bacterium]|jgi:cof-like hydrolase|nr:HAD family phosphatase [Clostridia bacterium]MBS5023392.1 HAD family phosphatase [Bacillota bacterium]
MRKINYPLIISDFDGTLLGSDGAVSDATKRKIDEYIAAGGTFGICTGRMFTSILPRARELGLKGLVASYQGSVITDIESGKLLVDGYLPADEAAEICKVFERLDLHTHVYTLNEFYVNRRDEALSLYEKICNVKGNVVEEEPLSGLVLRKALKIRKVLAMVYAEDKKRIFENVLKALGEKFYVTYSAANLVEVTSRAYSKGTAVKFMADYYGVPIERTIAAGDSLNDLPMLQAAGLGLAVKNADEALKDKAQSFPFTNDEDAIGKIIETYGFAKE